ENRLDRRKERRMVRHRSSGKATVVIFRVLKRMREVASAHHVIEEGAVHRVPGRIGIGNTCLSDVAKRPSREKQCQDVWNPYSRPRGEGSINVQLLGLHYTRSHSFSKHTTSPQILAPSYPISELFPGDFWGH